MKLKLFFLPIVLVVTLLVFIYFIKPAWSENGQLKEELAKEQKALEELISKSNSLEKAFNHYQEFSQNKDLINNAIPTSKSEDKLVGEINEAANFAGIAVNEIEFTEQKTTAKAVQAELLQDDQSVANEDSLAEVSMDIKVAGEYTQVKKFIELLGSTNRFVKFSLLDISRLKQSDDQISEGMVSGNISCKVFYKPENEVTAIAELISSGDKTMNRLLTGKISDVVIENFKKSRTGNVYELTPENNQPGKEDIFVGNTASLQSQSQEEPMMENQTERSEGQVVLD
ncbi:MAG: type 4a pilus biogenesis protein PilO [Candidatus Moranbacteria bacterium]|nr:type 4a pilus biogenesis protein PilO [Candidatus Moranbacteria bacterium]